MKTNREIRARKGVQFREATEDEKKAGFIGSIEGLIPYSSDSEKIYDRSLNHGKAFVEQIAPDAFKRSLAEDGDIMGFVGHTDDPAMAFARMGENLTATSDEQGLHWRAQIPGTTTGSDLAKNVALKIIRGASFEFSVRGEGEKWEKRGEQDVRTITDARLYTVNPVAFPAYLDSELTVSMRSATEGPLAELAEAVAEIIAARATTLENNSHDADWEQRQREAILVSPVVI